MRRTRKYRLRIILKLISISSRIILNTMISTVVEKTYKNLMVVLAKEYGINMKQLTMKAMASWKPLRIGMMEYGFIIQIK